MGERSASWEYVNQYSGIWFEERMLAYCNEQVWRKVFVFRFE